MQNIRPKSGHLRTGPVEDRRNSSKYEQRRYTKDICKSINILPIKIQNQNVNHDRVANQTVKNMNITSIKSGFSSTTNKEGKRRTILSIKSKPSLRFEDNEEFRLLIQQQDSIVSENKVSNTNTPNNNNYRRPSIEFVQTNPLTQLYTEEDTDKLFELLHKKKDIMMFDHTRLVMQAIKFKSLLGDFQSKFREVKTDRDMLEEKVNKYELYFKEMRLKHLPLPEEEQTFEKNQQLKILNLQKKVETLNYIIKQYRTNNSQQIKNFQQRLKDFKPNIEKQLTQKLAETNEKYQSLLKKVQFFQNQCKTNLKVNWQQLMHDFEQTKQQNQKNLKYINDLSKNITQLNEIMRKNEQRLKMINKLEDQNLQQKIKLQQLNDKHHQLTELIEQKDIKIDQLNHLYQETSFKLEGLQNLQFRIQNKDKTIKKNTIIINRLQCQNIELKTKMDTVLSEFQSRIFCQKSLQDHLSKANNSIHELTNRLHETFIDFCQNPSPEATKEKQYFIGHLFEKVKSSYNQIITEYQNQLKLINVQCDKWKETFDLISKNRDQKMNCIQKMKAELEKIQQKKTRCQENFNRLSSQALDQGKKSGRQCQNCKHLIAYWGQLQNSFSQMKHILQNTIRIQSLNPTESTSINQLTSEGDISSSQGKNRRYSELYVSY